MIVGTKTGLLTSRGWDSNGDTLDFCLISLGNYVVVTSLAISILQNLILILLDFEWHNFKNTGDGVLEKQKATNKI